VWPSKHFLLVYHLCLILKLPVRVLAEKSRSDLRQSVLLQEAQTVLEGVENLNLAIPTDDSDTTSPAFVSISSTRLEVWRRLTTLLALGASRRYQL